MSNYSEVLDLAKALTGNENLYSLQPFIKIAGDTTIGLFLERVVYWSDKSGDKKLRQLKIFYKSAEEWEDELGLSYAQITRARKELEAKGFIITNRRKVTTNGAPTIHYYANMDAIKEAITLYYHQHSNSGYANLDNSEIEESLISEKPQVEVEESPKSIEIQESESPLKDKSSNPINNSERESHAHKLKRIGEVDFLAQNRPFAVKLSEICGNPGPEYVTNGDRRKLAEAAAQLLDWNATIDQLSDFRQKWKFDDDPWLSQVVGQWGRYLTAKKRPQTKSLEGKASSNGHHSKRQQQSPVIPATEAEQARLKRMAAAHAAPDDP